MAKLDDEELLAKVQQEVNAALGYEDEISEQRKEALLRYTSQPYGNEVDGRSQVVDTTVMDTIEWIKPSLMRIFTSGDEVVKFLPEGPEDVPTAQQATDYINWILTRKNNWAELFLTWISDALLEKVGIIKVFWDDTEKKSREEYHDLTDVELEQLIASNDVEVLEHTERSEENDSDIEDPMEEMLVNPALHDVVITRQSKRGGVKISNIAPEEFLISREAQNVDDARFVCHRSRMTLAELREMGLDVDEDLIGSGDTGSFNFNMENNARHQFDNSQGWPFDNDEGEGALKEVWVFESYMRVEIEGGLSELRRILTCGNQVLANDPVDRAPFATICPIPMAHKFFGMSIADQVMDLQLVKTTLLRNLLDNMYLQNAGRVAVQEGMVNLDDLLSQRPGGIVRTKAPGAVTPLPTPQLQPYVFEMLGYIDKIREERSGMTKMSQGLDANALTSHTSATQVSQVMNAAQQRVELIARIFADTGVKKMANMIYELISKHQDKEQVIQLRNEWVPIRPDMWRDKMDCIVQVGLGHGNRDQQMMHLTQMMQFAGQAMSGGLSIITEQNLYNMGAALVKNMGFKDVDSYITDPSKQQQQQKGPSPQEQMAQAEMQIKQKELEIKAADVQIKAQKVQADAQEAKVDAHLKMQELALEAEQKRPVAIGRT
jgi:hypothetical protein